MSTRPDQFPRIATKKAVFDDVRRLFEELQIRAEIFARMLDEFTESIGRNREQREGKPVRMNSMQKRTLANYEKDAEQAVYEMERSSANMEDAALLGVMLAGTRQSIQLDEQMLSAWHSDDQPTAICLIEYQRETLRLVESFIDTSQFKGEVPALGYDRTSAKRLPH